MALDTFPGAVWKYSGGGFMILQKLVEDYSKKSLTQYGYENIFTKLGMTHSYFEVPLGESRMANTAKSHDRKGNLVNNGYIYYPELAAAGLWTTSSDLAKLGLSLMNGFNSKTENGVLSYKTIKSMLTVQKAPSGLGWFLNGKGQDFSFSHGGDTYGYKCEMLFYPKRNEGVVIMTNGEKGQLLIEEILRGLSLINGWVDYKVKRKKPILLSPAAMKAYTGTYRLTDYPSIQVVVSQAESDLEMTVEQPGILPLKAKLFYEGNEKFFRTDIDIELEFFQNRTKLRLNQSGQVFEATRK
ncbi:MAG: serine hydrolase [Chitinophagaceae bacterium]